MVKAIVATAATASPTTAGPGKIGMHRWGPEGKPPPLVIWHICRFTARPMPIAAIARTPLASQMRASVLLGLKAHSDAVTRAVVNQEVSRCANEPIRTPTSPQ